MRLYALLMLAAGCGGGVDGATSNCGPATSAYMAHSKDTCAPDGDVVKLDDGASAPILYICTEPDGSVPIRWCQP